ncbi:MAG TPA: hypothetical protein VLA56_15400 [Pseudomonadales bacterium]|nr:hypothetical protein [Pseudomonadales bacterium]
MSCARRRPDPLRGTARLKLVLFAFLLLSAPALRAASGTCPLRMAEPPLDHLSLVAHRADVDALGAARAGDDVALRRFAVVVEWYAARGSEDSERRTRATADLFEIWDAYRPAARLMRIVGVGLAQEGWPSPTPDAVVRRLSQLGDRGAVLARARQVAEASVAGEVAEDTLLDALRGATIMSMAHDQEALAVAEDLLRALDEPLAAAETILFRAEAGDIAALARLGDAYALAGAGSGACAARSRLFSVLFGELTPAASSPTAERDARGS